VGSLGQGMEGISPFNHNPKILSQKLLDHLFPPDMIIQCQGYK
jgi:hypothetical protein